MWGGISLSRIVIRVLEIAGAGLTSAVVAYLLGRTDAPPAPPAPPPVPAVVHLAPTDEEMIRSVRNDQAALLEQLRNEAQKAQAALEAPAAADNQVPSVVAKPAKPTPGNAQASAQTTMRRDPKPERARSADAKSETKSEAKLEAKSRVFEPRAEELLQTRQANMPVPATAPAPVVQQVPAAEHEPGLLTSTIRNLTAWILPSRDRVPVPDAGASRPPMPVREFQPNAM